MEPIVQAILTVVSMLLLVWAAVRDWNKTVREAGSGTFKELQALYESVKKELLDERAKREELEKAVEVLQEEIRSLKKRAQELADEITLATRDLNNAHAKIKELEKDLERKQAALDELLKKIK